MDLCRTFDLRFFVIQDRWDTSKFSARSIVDLKERYYDIVNALNKARHTTGPEPKLIAYDGDNEKRRKEQAKRLFDRTAQQVEEEANSQENPLCYSESQTGNDWSNCRDTKFRD